MDLKSTLSQIPAFKDRERIPAHKRRAQWRDTVTGVLVASAAFVLRWKLEMPWTAVFVMAFAGGFIASKQLMLTLLKVVPQGIAAIVSALSGKAPPE